MKYVAVVVQLVGQRVILQVKKKRVEKNERNFFGSRTLILNIFFKLNLNWINFLIGQSYCIFDDGFIYLNLILVSVRFNELLNQLILIWTPIT